jgi:hypothetical protein
VTVVQERDLKATRRSLLDWLSKMLPQSSSVEISALDVPAASGYSNETFLFEASWLEGTVREARALVARTQPPGPGLFPTYDVLKQAAVMETVKTHSQVPVPTVLWKRAESI